MSNFYLYSFLMGQGYNPLQIQQILHPFNPYKNFYLPSSINIRNQYSAFRPLMIDNSSLYLSFNNQKSFQQFDQTKTKQEFQINHQINQNKLILSENIFSNYKNSQKIRSAKVNSLNQEKEKKKRKKKQIKKISVKEKKQKQFKRNQTENAKRNVIPNEIHQMLSILFKKHKSEKITQKLIQKFTIQKKENCYSVKRFYLYQSLLKQKINHYVNQESLKVIMNHLDPTYKLYSFEEQDLYCKIGHILIKHFLDNEATLIILNSQRIKAQNKIEHLRTKRYLLNVLSLISKN